MAATVYISETNGTSASPSVTDNVANLNFGAFDGPNIVPALHPINVGSFAVVKWWRIKLAALGGSAQISNIKIWKSSGAYVTGEAIGGSWSPVSFSTAYALAVSSVGGGAIVTPFTGDGNTIVGASWSAVLVPTAAPGTANIFIAGSQAGILNAVGYSNYQPNGMATTGSTPIGLTNQKVFTIQYDEA